MQPAMNLGQGKICTVDRVFIDTNILCYTVDAADITKQNFCAKILSKLSRSGTGRISTQSLQEFSNVVIKKLKFPPEVTVEFLSSLIKSFKIYNNKPKNVQEAVRICGRYQLSFWDSLIISAAKASRCKIVYSEDLTDGQIIDGVKIVNPFKLNDL